MTPSIGHALPTPKPTAPSPRAPPREAGVAQQPGEDKGGAPSPATKSFRKGLQHSRYANLAPSTTTTGARVRSLPPPSTRSTVPIVGEPPSSPNRERGRTARAKNEIGNAASATSAAEETSQAEAESFRRASRLLDRLRWKRDLLLAAQGFVPHPPSNSSAAHDADHHDDVVLADRDVGPEEKKERGVRMRTQMFQLDFYEFYTLLERLLVLLLSLAGTRVLHSGLAGSRHAEGSRSEHSWHENVLLALEGVERAGMTLGTTGLDGRRREILKNKLASEPVWTYIKACKTLRNRWKEDGDGGPENSKDTREDEEDAREKSDGLPLLTSPTTLSDVSAVIVAALDGSVERLKASCDVATSKKDEETAMADTPAQSRTEHVEARPYRSWADEMEEELGAPFESVVADSMEWQFDGTVRVAGR